MAVFYFMLIPCNTALCIFDAYRTGTPLVKSPIKKIKAFMVLDTAGSGMQAIKVLEKLYIF